MDFDGQGLAFRNTTGDVEMRYEAVGASQPEFRAHGFAAGSVALMKASTHFVGRFTAMASPCEVLVETSDERLARHIAESVAGCALRIERKFSRYRVDSLIQKINTTAGEECLVDDETANLLDFAATLTELSQGRFDITSGVLRRAWIFDGSDRVPTQAQIEALLPSIGWHRVKWRRPILQLQEGMQIDFGGIGKEYAVDTASGLAESIAPGTSCLINFGGDIAARNPRVDGAPWHVGIEHPERTGSAARLVELKQGAMATSGDARRFVAKDGHRYSHILDARTGWPVEDAPRSITVVADTCTQAGTITTLAMLQGSNAESFLRDARVQCWTQR